MRCGGGYKIVVNWNGEEICGYCYQQAKRTRGNCIACGHEGVLPGRLDGQPACRRCSGVTLNVDCIACGAEDEIYKGGMCWACTLSRTVDDLLTNPSTGDMATELVPLATVLKSMQRANSGLTWIRQEHVTEFLRNLAITAELTHESFDDLPRSRTREYVRGLLVEHGILPRRDELKARYRQWAGQALERINDPRQRDVIERYIRWHDLRRMNEMESVTNGTFLRSKQRVTVAINFVNWLTEHAVDLDQLTQTHLDAWVVDGPGGRTTRLLVDSFLNWAIKTRLTASDLTVPPHRRGGGKRLDTNGQDHALHTVVHTEDLSVRDRAAGILLLVFGQQIENVVTMTWDDVTITDDIVTVRIGTTDIALPEPLDTPWRHLSTNPGNDQTAAHPNTQWVFRGYSPGRHIDASHLRDRLRRAFSTRAARLGTLHELTKHAPCAIIAEALGYSAATIERHAIASAAVYAEYVAAIEAGHDSRSRQ